MKKQCKKTVTRWVFSLACFCVSVSIADTCCADEFFVEKVAPIFERRCLSCHSDQQQAGGYSLQSAETAVDEGIIEPGKPESSLLLDVIQSVDGKADMPRDGQPLTDSDVATIRRWIELGAKWPEGHRLVERAAGGFDWWAYKPMERPAVPQSCRHLDSQSH